MNVYEKYKDDIESVIKEHGYSGKLEDCLKILMPVIIDYYGDENRDLILKTLKKTPIEIISDSRTIADVLNETVQEGVIYKGLDGSPANNAIAKKASGVYISRPVLSKSEDGYKIDGRKRKIAVRNSDDSIFLLSTIAHEVSHAIKSEEKEFSIENTEEGCFLTQRSGLNITKSEVTMQDEHIVVKDLEERATGIEEGINAYDEENIINSVLKNMDQVPEESKELLDGVSKDKYTTKGYGTLKVVAKILDEECGCDVARKTSQIKGTDDFRNEVESGKQVSYDDMIAALDKEHWYNNDMFNHIFDMANWKKEHETKRNANIGEINRSLKAVREQNKSKEIDDTGEIE